jgi:hypothetical protein
MAPGKFWGGLVVMGVHGDKCKNWGNFRIGAEPGAVVKCASRIVISWEGLGQRNNKGK